MGDVHDVKDDTVVVQKFEDISSSTIRPEISERDKNLARRLLWKVDLWVLPILTVLYLITAMDRSDIGNAQVAGMQKAIGASASEWAKVVSLFYIGFIVSQPFGSLFLRKLTPPVLFGLGVTLWGAVMICFIEVKTWPQAAAIRILIGVGEGITHSTGLYLSLWYMPKELAFRGSIIYSTASLAGAFNGLIAYAITKDYSNKPPWSPWQWLFFVEGLLSTCFGLVILVFLPPVPEKLKWGWTPEEKRMAVIRTQWANNTPGSKIRWKEVIPAFKSPMFISWTYILAANQIALAGLSNFMPSIIKGMGYSSVRAQLMSVPIYAAAFVSTLSVPYVSDRLSLRGPFVAGLSCFSIVGLIMLIVSHHNPTRYAGAILSATGLYPIVTINLTWIATNTPNFTHRATISAFVNVFAQAISVGVLQAFTDPPFYKKGLTIVLCFVALIPIAALSASWYARRFNAQKPALDTVPVEERRKTLEELGVNHPEFFLEL
ncbi:hypothetical protein LTR84_001780 [Exophiala bonariae]|uniref:Major facilitator superfamily (MFS) profile domain-containing protein n=1 Tax=Exophiala bonariae TaxID=1690606 RepID=A0AAV9NBJ2_9EURO|nr:hypothetical protein LTR84_001780 [Exophiala bonariae]